jgi:Ser/Thr protein kinase RdoA (MazF antagonist)
MNPGIIQQIKKSDALNYFCSVFGLQASLLKQVELYDGAANLLYYNSVYKPSYLRISYRKDRNPEMYHTELNFLNYLSENDYPCPKPIKSQNGNFCEQYQVQEHLITASLFSEIKGLHIYERQFQLPQGVTFTQFWQHCGKTLGTLHTLSNQYQCKNEVKRFSWLEIQNQSLSFLFPENLAYQELLQKTIREIGSVAKSPNSYRICHNDFNVGNFLIDYESKDFKLNLIDFDDSGWNYFMYDLVCFWEMNTGWAYNLLKKTEWSEYMYRSFSVMLEAYHKNFSPDFDAISLLPTFLKAVHIENILEPMRELHYSNKPLIPDEEISYHIHCLQNNIEYLGLFDDCFDPNNPFSLS